MKIFKKLTLLLVLAVCAFSMTACSSTNLSTDGYLWFKDPSAFKPGWTEECVYDVSFVHTTPNNSTELKADGYSLDVQNGTYTTKLTTFTDNGQYYVYETEFNLTFKYIEPNVKDEDEDGNPDYKTYVETFTTVTEFKSNLTPVRSEKIYASSFSNYKYNYVLNYDGSTATAVFKESDYEGKAPNNQTFTFKKYNKKAYIDNDIILLIPRLFNIDDDFGREFKTVDVLSNKLFDMQLYAYLDNGNLDVKNLANYTLNGVEPTENSANVSCAHVQITIDDTFSGNPIDCYYAQDRNTHRHRLVETYTRFGTLGYIKFHLASVTVNGD